MALAQAVAANFYVRPATVELLVRYVMSNFTPFDTLTDDYESTRLLDLERDVRTLLCYFVCRPTDFRVYLYHGAPSQKRTWSALVDPWGNGCAVPDALFLQQPEQTPTALVLAALTANPDAHWMRVTTGDTMGHVSALSFRHMDEMNALYSPTFMIVALVREVVRALVPLLEKSHGSKAKVFQRLAASMWPLPHSHLGAVDDKTRDFLRAMQALFGDARATIAQVSEKTEAAWRNYSAIAAKTYAQLRAMGESPVPAAEFAQRFVSPVYLDTTE